MVNIVFVYFEQLRKFHGLHKNDSDKKDIN